MSVDWRQALQQIDPVAEDALGPEAAGLVAPIVFVGDEPAREWLGRQLPGPNVLLVPGSAQAGWILPLLRCKSGLTVLWLDRDVARLAQALDAVAQQDPDTLPEMILTQRLVLDPGGQADASTDRFLQAADFSRRPVIRILDAELVDEADMQMLLEMTEGARALVRYESCDLATRLRFGKSWQSQTVRNLPAIVKQAAIKHLFGVFAGIPAVVVAAGPSLADVVPYIARHRHRLVVICVGRVLSHLVYRAGIMPDLVVTGDGQDYVVKHFTHKPPLIPVVASSFTDPTLIETLDRVFFMEIESMHLPQWIQSKVGELGEVFPGGNVSTAAMAVAEVLGCNPVLTAGLDLSYPDDGKTHVSGRSLADRSAADPAFSAPKTYMVPGNHQAQVQTNRQMYHYIDFTSEFVENHPGTQFVNLNTAGARINGMELEAPDALARYLDKPVNAAGRIAKCYAAGAGDASLEYRCRASLEADIPQLHSLRKQCLDAAMICNQLIMLVRQPGLAPDPEARLHELLGALAPVDQRLREDPVMNVLYARIENATHSLSQRMLSTGDLLLSASVRSHKRWRSYYMDVAKACEDTEKVLAGAICRLRKMQVCEVNEEEREDLEEVAV